MQLAQEPSCLHDLRFEPAGHLTQGHVLHRQIGGGRRTFDDGIAGRGEAISRIALAFGKVRFAIGGIAGGFTDRHLQRQRQVPEKSLQVHRVLSRAIHAHMEPGIGMAGSQALECFLKLLITIPRLQDV